MQKENETQMQIKRTRRRSAVMVILALASVLCLSYGAVIFSIRSGTGFFAVWIAAGLLLGAAAWAMGTGSWSMLPHAIHRIMQAIAILAVLWLAITQALVISGFNGAGTQTENEDLDCIIVLGAQVRADGPSAVLQNRLDTALAYLQAHPRTACIVSGGRGATEPEAEAAAMARYLQEHGVNPSRIRLEDRSLNTVGNIRNSKALLTHGEQRIGVVTNNFHVFRSVAIARKQGLEAACGLAAPSQPLFLPNNMLRESFGITKDLLLGNL